MRERKTDCVCVPVLIFVCGYHIQQGISTLIYERRHQDCCACLLLPSVFQGAGAGLKIAFLFYASFWQCKKWQSSEAEKVAAIAFSYGENAPFPASGPTWMPLGRGQDALGSVLLIGRFLPRWMQETLLSPAGEITACKSLCAFHLFIKLIQTLVGSYIYSWAQMTFFPSVCEPLKGTFFFLTEKLLYYIVFFKKKK